MSEPTPPGAPAPPAPGLRAKGPDSEPPPEVKRATTLYTATAAFLVFIGVTSLVLLRDAERELRRQLNELDDEAITAVLDPGMIRATLIALGVAVLVVAIGHGLTAQALRDRKSWARPVGFTFSGILLAVAVLGAVTGAVSIQTIFFLVAGLSGILTLAKPAVRDYLQPWPKTAVPAPLPPPGGWPPGPGGPGSGPVGPPPTEPRRDDSRPTS